MGRASLYSDALIAEILERVASGEPLAQVVRDGHMPGLQTVYDWMERYDGLAVRFARARDAGYDMIAADVLTIADGGGPGTNSDPTRDKLRVETRLKLLAKWDPKRYGEVQQLRLAGHEGQNLRDVSESEAATRVASILEAVRRRAVPLLLDGGESSED